MEIIPKFRHLNRFIAFKLSKAFSTRVPFLHRFNWMSQFESLKKSKQIVLRTIFVFALIVFTSSSGLAAIKCEAVFSNQKVITEFKELSVDELSSEVMHRIQSHPIYQFSQSVASKGKDLIFKFRGGPNANFGISKNLKGESIQSQQLAKYLRFLFPNAKIKAVEGVDFQHSGDGIPIDFFVYDPAEVSKPYVFEKDVVLPMPLLKGGNPGQVYSKNALRKIMGVPQGAKIIHFYLKNEVVHFDHFLRIKSEIEKIYSPDIIIVSHGNQHETGSPFKVKNFIKGNDLNLQFKNLFDLSSLVARERVIDSAFVFNDSTGLMGQLHAMSDFAVVVGPINFMEPLSVGTKTLYVDVPTSEIFTQYNSDTLSDLVQVGLKSGGFVASDLSHVRVSMEKLTKLPQPKSPIFTEIDGRSKFDLVLDRLFELISRQSK